MQTANVVSGVGCERDAEMAVGFRVNKKTYNEGITRERLMCPLRLSEAIRHRDFVQGDLVSVRQGKVVPLDPELEFAGVIDRIGEDRGIYVASVWTRGAVVVNVSGLNANTHQGMKVYAVPAGHTQVFSLAEQGVLIGEVCAIESFERGNAIVGFRQREDARPFELSGNRPN